MGLAGLQLGLPLLSFRALEKVMFSRDSLKSIKKGMKKRYR